MTNKHYRDVLGTDLITTDAGANRLAVPLSSA
jgi:hypothetical protein